MDFFSNSKLNTDLDRPFLGTKARNVKSPATIYQLMEVINRKASANILLPGIIKCNIARSGSAKISDNQNVIFTDGFNHN